MWQIDWCLWEESTESTPTSRHHHFTAVIWFFPQFFSNMCNVQRVCRFARPLPFIATHSACSDIPKSSISFCIRWLFVCLSGHSAEPVDLFALPTWNAARNEPKWKHWWSIRRGELYQWASFRVKSPLVFCPQCNSVCVSTLKNEFKCTKFSRDKASIFEV